MATPFSDVYNSFLERITDYGLLSFDETNRESMMLGYLKRSCSKFKRICLKKCKLDLSDRDDTIGQFNSDLNDEIIDVVVTGMCVEWLKPKYLLDENMRNVLNTKDYSMASSPANMANSIRATYLQTKQEFESMMKTFSFTNGNIEELKND